MTKLKIFYTEIHRVKKTYVEEIDLSSATQWTALIEKVRSRIGDDDFVLDDFPVEPSENLDDWLFLYQFLNADEYSKQIEGSDSSNNEADCEREWSIQNKKGEVLLSDPNLEP
ncbi:MAG: hypothetical protein JHD08_05650 [Candidatus Nanopelagicales bacterium]|jgi:hypothetical protein|nr:hypothetical protein [Candidatus Nanopelagicales bacterium]